MFFGTRSFNLKIAEGQVKNDAIIQSCHFRHSVQSKGLSLYADISRSIVRVILAALPDINLSGWN